jgi:general secretion pathway protein N
MIDRLVVYLLLAGCIIFGAIVLLELKSTSTDRVAPSGVAKRDETAPPVRRPPTTRLDDLLAQALARPLFSSTRRPPQAAANDSVTSSDLADTRLTGIVTEPGHHVAIFAVNGAKPLRLTEGEAVSGWRIESITPREVSLSGPGGTKTLEPKLDPNLVQSPVPTPAANPAARLPAPPAAAQPAPAANVVPRPGVPPGRPPRIPIPPRARAQQP